MLVGCVLISALIWWLFARVMTAKTLKGARTHIAVLGFQEFMNRVDADRLKIMPPDTFEKFLPYAMALGVEHHWAQAFAGILKTPPTWYAAPAGYAYGTMFNPILFSSSMHGMATDMHQYLFPRRERVPADRVSAEAASVAAADSPAADSAAAAGARLNSR